MAFWRTDPLAGTLEPRKQESMDRAGIKVGIMFGLMFAAGCNVASEEPAVNGAVLSPGHSIQASNKNGKVRISYVTSVKRKYEWDGRVKIVTMIPRKELFEGRLGLYNPASSWGLNPFEIRLVVEEAAINFASEEQIYAFLRQSSDYMDWVYTNNGLVVGFGRTPSRRQINIDLWQILLRGQKPNGLIGAKPEDIVVLGQK